MIFLTETKCIIRFIYVRFNYERKKWGKRWMEKSAIRGGEGVPTPNGKSHEKFPLFWNPSRIIFATLEKLNCDPASYSFLTEIFVVN